MRRFRSVLVSGNFGNGLTLSCLLSLGALRIIFLGIPSLLFALAVSSLVTTALWTWLTADLALAALR